MVLFIFELFVLLLPPFFIPPVSFTHLPECHPVLGDLLHCQSQPLHGPLFGVPNPNPTPGFDPYILLHLQKRPLPFVHSELVFQLFLLGSPN